MPFGGMNEQGLAIEMLWLDYTTYFHTPNNPYLNELEWIQYQLDNYATVVEVVAHLNQLSIQPFKGKIHFIIADADGHSVVIEHIGGKIKYESKQLNQCQAITNYDITTSHEWYSNQSNRLNGNVTNPLYRYGFLQTQIEKNNFATTLSATDALKILDNVAIRKRIQNILEYRI
ncbi:MAG: linear amide C-N hydrolase [Spirosomataceae bacterium]